MVGLESGPPGAGFVIPDREAARARLRELFGHEDFLPLQGECIEHLLGGGDALVLMPTGAGKSLCYQLPAVLRPGTGIVLSPLIALMQDQVDGLQARGVRATAINSSLERHERERRLEAVVRGEIDLLYVTPERFRQRAFVEALAEVPIALLAVDEAHCISSWGHDFRPDYGRVGRIREVLGRPPTIALTATATPETQSDILGRLDLRDARVFHAGIERPNLHIGVHRVRDLDERDARMVEVIDALGGPGIVYFALIRELSAFEERLRRQGREVFVYHGDLSAHERRTMQRSFLASRDGVALATNAFGMGVDKADIRFILHAQLPGSLEAYYQEIGRAGRDGLPSVCELLYREEDLLIQKQFLEWGNPSPEFVRSMVDEMRRREENLYAFDLQDLREALLLKNRRDGRPDTVLGLLRSEGIVEGSFERGDLRLVRDLEPGEESRLVDPEKRRRDLERLLDIVRYAGGEDCRRRVIHGYFGFESEEACGHCDVCRATEEVLAELAEEGGGAVPTRRAETEDDAPVRRGDWLLIDRREHVVVKKVERTRKGYSVEVERARDLTTRRYDLGRVRWEKVS